MPYAAIDPIIQEWRKRHSLSQTRSFAGREVRSFYVSSTAGECFHIWIDPPHGDVVWLNMACIEGRGDDDAEEHEWRVDVNDLARALEEVIEETYRCMWPAVRLPLVPLN